MYDNKTFTMPVVAFLQSYRKDKPKSILKRTSTPRFKLSLKILNGSYRMETTPKAKVTFRENRLQRNRTCSSNRVKTKTLNKNHEMNAILAIRRKHFEYTQKLNKDLF